MTIGDLAPKGDGWIVKELKEIKRKIAQLSTARAGNRMTIDGAPGVSIINGGAVVIYDGGSLKLVTPSGQVVMLAGQATIPDGSGRKQQIFQIGRDDGTTALYVADYGTVNGHPHQQAWALLDRAQNIVCAEDTISGVGLARPYIPCQFVDINTPAMTTTSTTFQALQWGYLYMQHPKFTAAVLCNTPAGTTGEFRFTNTGNGAQIGSTITVPSGSFSSFTLLPSTLPGFVHENTTTVQLEGRVTGGTGALGLRTIGAWTVQS